jgi:hypothetical protein
MFNGVQNKTLTLLFGLTFLAGNVHAQLKAELTEDQVKVYVADKLFTSYKFAAEQKYPYFYPVNGPTSGESVTTESSEPYPHHHSLFLGCDRVNGGNYWQDSNNRGQIVSQGPKIVVAEGAQVVIEDTCDWKQPGKDPILRETRTITLTAPTTDKRVIDFTTTWEALVEVRIEQSNHALFAARMAPELSVNGTGVLVNAEGDSGEKATWGKTSNWCDYSGTRNGKTEGLAILQHPDNPWYPAPWFTRDYGFFSPTPMQWLEGGEFVLSKGETLNLRYRVVVHAGDAKAADISGAFQAFVAE